MSEDNDWKGNLPDFVQNWPEVKEAKAPDELWQRVADQRTHLGNSIRIPSEEAGEADWQEFNEKMLTRVPALMRTPDTEDENAVNDVLTKLGKPDKKEKYELPESDGVSFADGQDDVLREMALNAGLTKRQFKKVAEHLGKQHYESTVTAKTSQQNQLNAISSAWGLSAEEKYKNVLNFAKAANAPESLVNAIENRNIDADTVFWLDKMNSSVSTEGTPMFKKDENHPVYLTPYEAQQKIDDILNNPDHGYHKGDPIARKRMHELMAAKAAG